MVVLVLTFAEKEAFSDSVLHRTEFLASASLFPLLPLSSTLLPSFSSSLSLFFSILFFSPYTFCLVLRQKRFQVPNSEG